jgi:hypothetical protein
MQNSIFRAKLLVALMVLVSFGTANASFAYSISEPVEAADSHDSSYVRSLQRTAQNDLNAQSEATTDQFGTAIWNGERTEPLVEITTTFTADDFEGHPVAALPPVTPSLAESLEVIEVDNDHYKEPRKDENSRNKFRTSTWSEVRSDEGQTVILAGARFPVVLTSAHNSRSCHIGDRVEARLKSDILIGDRLIARKDATVLGHVSTAHKARRILIAQLAPKRWLRANGAIGIKFDEIITQEGEHIPLTAAPARMARIIENKAEGRILGINHKGEVAAPLSTQLKNQGIQLAIRGAAGAGGVFSMGAVPVIFGLIGAANPSFAFLHPVGQNVPHRRWKGFGMGFLSGLPGGFLVADFILKGVEAALKPGDEFLVEFQQDFNGEAATVAELQPQESMKVKAQIVPSKKRKTMKNRKRPLESKRTDSARNEGVMI